MVDEPKKLEELVRIVKFEAKAKDAKPEPFDPRDYDYFPPGEAWSNGHDAKAQKQFELTPFGQITLNTKPAYLVKGLIPSVGLTVVWGPPKCGKSFLMLHLTGRTAAVVFERVPLSIAHWRDARRLRTALRPFAAYGLPTIRTRCHFT
jgi:AAA domain